MADAGRRKFDAVIVWRFDRFARSVSHLLRALEGSQALGVDFISLSENVDTSTPTGKMVFTVLGAVAELERSLIVEHLTMLPLGQKLVRMVLRDSAGPISSGANAKQDSFGCDRL